MNVSVELTKDNYTEVARMISKVISLLENQYNCNLVVDEPEFNTPDGVEEMSRKYEKLCDISKNDGKSKDLSIFLFCDNMVIGSGLYDGPGSKLARFHYSKFRIIVTFTGDKDYPIEFIISNATGVNHMSFSLNVINE